MRHTLSNRVYICDIAQVMDARQFDAGHVDFANGGTRGEHELVIGETFSVRRRNLARVAVDGLNTCLEPNLDILIVIKRGRLEVKTFRRQFAREKFF